jgi:hypothetical protein
MYIGPRVKYPFFGQISVKLEFSRQILEEKILKHQLSQKSFQGEASCSTRTDGRTEKMTKLVVALQNFANVHKINSTLTENFLFLHCEDQQVTAVSESLFMTRILRNT